MKKLILSALIAVLACVSMAAISSNTYVQVATGLVPLAEFLAGSNVIIDANGKIAIASAPGGGSGTFSNLVAGDITNGAIASLTISSSGGLSVSHGSSGGNSTLVFSFVESNSNTIPATASNSFMQSSASNAFMQASASGTWVKVSGETNALDLTNATITVKTPSSANEVATKGYVDSGFSGSASNAIGSIWVEGTNYTTLMSLILSGSNGVQTLDKGSSGGTNEVVIRLAGTSTGLTSVSSRRFIGGSDQADLGTNTTHFIGGGRHNSVDGSLQNYCVVAGGFSNRSYYTYPYNYTVIGGGAFNWVDGESCTIGGGNANRIGTSNQKGTIAGGYRNLLTSQNGVSIADVIGGGEGNLISQNAFNGAGWNAIAGGYYNVISGWVDSVSGGMSNRTTFNSGYSHIGGGQANVIEATFSAIPGGQSNWVATQAVSSVAMGNKAKAAHANTFVWNSYNGTNGYVSSTASNQFIVSAVGGVGLGATQPVQKTISAGYVLYVAAGTADVSATAGMIAFDSGEFRICRTNGTWEKMGATP